MLAKIRYDSIHMRLHRQHAGHGVVADDRTLEARMLDVVDLAEHVVRDLAIDVGAAVLVKSVFVHFPSVL